jgi:serine-type D-Ala-D-Ala carboxypeptidase/endopeptidase
MYRIGILILLLISGIVLPAGALSPDDWRSDAPGKFSSLTREQVDSVMLPLIHNGTYVGGIVVLVDENGSAIYEYGLADRSNRIRPDGKTVFGIGSITKTFTGLLLADAHIRGELDLKAPLKNYVPDGVRVPVMNNREITLEDLATHTSGLPGVTDQFSSIAENLSPADQIEQAFGYYETIPGSEAYAYISNYTLTREPGSEWEYSNLGTSIAGEIVSRTAGTSYSTLLDSRILNPLGMNQTTVRISDDLTPVATGYRGYGSPVDEARLIHFNDFWAATGGIFSTGEDMAIYLAAQLGIVDTPFNSALHLSHQPRTIRSEGPPEIWQGLFWDIIETSDKTRIYLKAGETNGYQSDIGMIPDEKRGVVILMNTALLSEKHVESQAVTLLEMMHGRAFS